MVEVRSRGFEAQWKVLLLPDKFTVAHVKGRSLPPGFKGCGSKT